MGRDNTSFLDGFLFNVAHVGGHAANLRAEQLVLLVLKVHLVARIRANLRAHRAVRRQPLIVFEAELLVPLHGAIPILLRPFVLMCKLRHHEMVHAENPGNGIHDVSVQSTNRGAHHHNRRDAENEPKQGEKCPEFLGPDGLHSDASRICEKLVEMPHCGGSIVS